MQRFRVRHLTVNLVLAGLLPMLIGCSTTPEAVQKPEISFTATPDGVVVRVTNPGSGVVRLGGDARFDPISLQVRISDEAGQPYLFADQHPWAYEISMMVSSYFPRERPVVIRPGASLERLAKASDMSRSLRPRDGFRGEMCRYRFLAHIQTFGRAGEHVEAESYWMTAPCEALFPPKR